ncbi:hypothetical protein [Sulfurimonas autotrophica]|uniref:Uncharacterized protein n=1 Tax=Sulfurimonas autotrophica (strain ATCC BAA-671 / DSM 16294 / JCM 11897 / OK10) TaxID=563040 RepID=E0UQW8_SULAO|nr:hypothetical protein [Sulfurimonas autotrophica]ADN08849.1 hypothetical protein Saut_0800 [Sulfurimonas autotrophica DSM 16294]
MAKVEFYEINIRDTKNGIAIDENIVNKIKNRLLELPENDLLCSNKTCLAILSEFKENKNSITFDFSKLTNEVINSTIISKPLDSIDTFEEFNNMESDKALPTVEEIEFIIRLTSEYENDDLVNKLMKSEIEYFTIYKILRDNRKLITPYELELFCSKTIQRMKKEKIFFNITRYKQSYILMFQKAVHGFDVEHLLEYLNSHLLVNENLRLHFKKIYDMSFMDALQNSDLKSFKFSYSSESKNNLIEENFATPLYFLTKMLGTNITISVNNDKDLLDNKKLLRFFEMANEAGMLDMCKIKKFGTSKEIKSTDKGLELNYTTKHKIDNIDQANDFFEEAFENKEDILSERIG